MRLLPTVHDDEVGDIAAHEVRLRRLVDAAGVVTFSRKIKSLIFWSSMMK